MLKGHHSRGLAFALLTPLLLHAATTDLLSDGNSLKAQGKLTPKDPKVVAAVAKGMQYLKSFADQQAAKERSFAVATAISAGASTDEKWVSDEIKRILEKFKVTYDERVSCYEPAADLMALCTARHYDHDFKKKPDAYRQEIQAVVNFLIVNQKPTGDWDYFGRGSGEGDTSQTQIVLLALWSATQVGFDVPLEVWEKAAKWFLETQYSDGGFSYHPRGPKDHGVEHGMTAAGVSGLLIARLHLYTPQQLASGASNAKGVAAQEEKRQHKLKEELEKKRENPFQKGRRDEKAKEDADSDEIKPARPAGQSTIPLSQINGAISKGVAWLAKDYRMKEVQRFDLYYRYGIERLTALLEMEDLGGHDWYTDGALCFLEEQDEAEGHWGGATEDGTRAGTCFGILFLTRATWKKLVRIPPPPPPNTIAGGQQRGYQGDPRKMTAGGESAPPPTGPLEDLLKDLISQPDSPDAPKRANLLAEKLIEDIRVNPEKRDELIGQKENLKLLAEVPNDEARIGAIWALGRCEDLGLAPLLIKALADDNIDISTAARDSLCVLSRRPKGEGLARHPWADLPENATEEVKSQAFLQWRTTALQRWRKWYSRIQPYDQRDDLADVGVESN